MISRAQQVETSRARDIIESLPVTLPVLLHDMLERFDGTGTECEKSEQLQQEWICSDVSDFQEFARPIDTTRADTPLFDHIQTCNSLPTEELLLPSVRKRNRLATHIERLSPVPDYTDPNMDTLFKPVFLDVHTI